MPAEFDRLESELEHCLVRDRRTLGLRISGLRRRYRRGQPTDRGIRALHEAMERSKNATEARRANLPALTYPGELPVSARRQEIATAIRNHQVVVICGETGSGKTTQLPKICLELGRGVAGVIGHTQPRRIAARSVANRIAEELGSPLGLHVGFKIRFSDHTSRDGYIKLVTDGILLAEIQQDRHLEQYDTIIIDEAHERSLNIDFLLGYLTRLLPKRPDLKLVITSATIDPERFSRHFGGAPVVNVSGRTYPVEVRYRPLVSEDPDQLDRDQIQGILDAVDELARLGPGDVLVFLSGEREIRETAEALRKHHPPNTEILPLYSRLSAAEQDRAFRPHHGRRIVLATNVAETSLTVPGIRYVVDPGYARISRYSVRSKIQRLPVEAVSRASAEQRKGRCGRVSEGICIRLYSESDFTLRPEFTEPEILRTNLASVILQMGALSLGDVATFPFVEPPDSRQINDGYKLLEELRAVDERRQVTDLGRQLSRLPLDPRLGRMVLAARDYGCISEALIVVSALSVQDPRERPLDAQQAADEKHARFRDDRSDFVSFLKLWEYYHDRARHLSGNQLRKLCRREFLSYLRLREWHDTKRQLQAQVKDMGLMPNAEPAEYAAIHKAILAGLLSTVGVKDNDNWYLGARNRKFLIFPGSALAKPKPKWVMAGELVETSRLFARNVARIDPLWIEELAPHLLKRNYFNPRWEKRSGRVTADLQLTLYGLVVMPRRSVNYGPVAPVEARELFIREALVAGHLITKAPFFEHNRALMDEVEDMEAKGRRRDLLVDEDTLARFYAEKLPADVWDAHRFQVWRARQERENPKALFLTRDYLMRHSAENVTADRFPDELAVHGMKLPLSYHFEPGSDIDGVTVTIPLAALNQLDDSIFDWLVPGMLEEKMTALIRSLPKPLRRNFVPAPEYARVCRESLEVGKGSLTRAMGQTLKRITGIEVAHEAWDLDSIPIHLRMRFRVVDGEGRELDIARKLSDIQARHEGRAQESFESLPSRDFEKQGLTRWEFGNLEKAREIRRGGLTFFGYPAIIAESDSVSLKLLETPEKAAAATRTGVRRLVELGLPDETRRIRNHLPGIQPMCLAYARIGRCKELKNDLTDCAIDRAFFGDGVPTTREAFDSCLARGRGRFGDLAEELCRLVGTILAKYQGVASRLEGNVPLAAVNALSDARSQLEHLIYRGFVTETPEQRLVRIPAYLSALAVRLDKLEQDPVRDRERLVQIAPLWGACLSRMKRNRLQGTLAPELETYRWMLEEYRISLFAQEIGTPKPISAKRLQQQWARVG